MITKEEFEKAVEVCTTGDLANCFGCPLVDKPQECSLYLTEYIKNEPALSANSTSSEVVSKDTDNIHIDNSTKERICQAYDTAYKACTDILLIYDEMSECERRAFDIGETYGKICSTRDKLEKLKGGDGK